MRAGHRAGVEAVGDGSRRGRAKASRDTADHLLAGRRAVLDRAVVDAIGDVDGPRQTDDTARGLSGICSVGRNGRVVDAIGDVAHGAPGPSDETAGVVTDDRRGRVHENIGDRGSLRVSRQSTAKALLGGSGRDLRVDELDVGRGRVDERPEQTRPFKTGDRQVVNGMSLAVKGAAEAAGSVRTADRVPRLAAEVDVRLKGHILGVGASRHGLLGDPRQLCRVRDEIGSRCGPRSFGSLGRGAVPGNDRGFRRDRNRDHHAGQGHRKDQDGCQKSCTFHAFVPPCSLFENENNIDRTAVRDQSVGGTVIA